MILKRKAKNHFGRKEGKETKGERRRGMTDDLEVITAEITRD